MSDAGRAAGVVANLGSVSYSTSSPMARRRRSGSFMFVALTSLGLSAIACRALMGVDPLELAPRDNSLAGHGGEQRGGAGGAPFAGNGGVHSGDTGGVPSAGEDAGGTNEPAGGGGHAGDSAAGGGGQGGEGGEPSALGVPHHISISSDFFPWTCAIHEGGLYCWEGADADRALLARPDGNPGDPLVPGPVAGRFGTFTAEQISAGHWHNCAVQEGRVYCWGEVQFGRLGSSGGPLGAPVEGDVDFANIIELSAGNSFSCARTAALSVFCWGDHAATIAFGQLTPDFDAAGGPYPYSETAFRVDSLKGATHVAVGNDHGCAALANGTPVCWGRNDFRQAGQAVSDTCVSTSNPPSAIHGDCVKHPTAVAGLGPVRQFALGERHSCALETGGKVRCWGNNKTLQLGGNAADSASCTIFDASNAPETCSATPVEVPEAEGASFIAACNYSSCAVKNGEVWCWGDNGDNVLGRGSDAAAVPGRVKLASGGLLEDVAEIALGDNIGCALTHDSKLFCWGRDYKTDTVLDGAIPVSW